MSEAFYDREIAPALMELANKCEAEGLSLVAMCEFAPNDTGMTLTVREGAGVKLRLASWAIQAAGNADALIGKMLNAGVEHGHNSVYLTMLEPKSPKKYPDCDGTGEADV